MFVYMKIILYLCIVKRLSRWPCDDGPKTLRKAAEE